MKLRTADEIVGQNNQEKILNVLIKYGGAELMYGSPIKKWFNSNEDINLNNLDPKVVDQIMDITYQEGVTEGIKEAHDEEERFRKRVKKAQIWGNGSFGY